MISDEKIEKLLADAANATPGPWETESVKSDGEYGSGEDIGSGYMTSALYNANGKCIADALNSDGGCVKEEYHEDGCDAWDEVARRNFTHIANCDPQTITALCEELKRLRAKENG